MVQAKKRGRPREFDTELVLDRATEAFLRSGYSGTSLDLLTKATGLSKPSLYGAFGDKRGLYMRVVERRGRVLGERYRAAFERGNTLQTALHAMFDDAVTSYLGGDGVSPGCLITSPSTTEAVEDAAIAEFTRAFFALCDKVVAGWLQAKWPPHTTLSPEAVARLAMGVIHDISLRARVGESRTKLRSLARDAARALASAANDRPDPE